MNQQNSARNGGICSKDGSPVIEAEDSDIEMDTEEVQNGHGDSCINGKTNPNNGYQNGNSESNITNKSPRETSNHSDNDEDMGK